MFNLMKSVTLSHVAKAIGLDYVGNPDFLIAGVSPLSEMKSGCLTFSKSNENQIFLDDAAVIVSVEGDSGNYLISTNPRLDFIRCLEFLDSDIGFEQSKIKPIVHPTVKIGMGVVLENGVEIGEGSKIEPNVTIMSNTKIGKNCLIRSNTSIGSSGFGFERADDGTPIKFIHLGGVIIGDNVEIGSCTCIAKGTLGNTVIEDNVKIDNLVHVAHNCIIRNGAFLIACSEISGGVDVGRNSWIAPNACLTQKITIGDNALVGLGAVVTKNVEPLTVVAGNPAKKLRTLKA